VPRAITASALVALALAAGGCGLKQEPTGTGVAEHYPLTIDDAAARSVVIRARVENAVSLDPGGAGLLRSLGVRVQVPPSGATPADVRRAEPDLVIVPASTRGQAAATLASEAGAPVFVNAGRKLTLVEHVALELGRAAGRGSQGRKLALALRRRRQAVVREVADRPHPRVVIDIGLGFAPEADSLLVALVRLAGGRVVGLDGKQPISPARLRTLRPDVYLATASSDVTLASLRADAATRDLPVVQAGRVVTVDDSGLVPDQSAYALLEQLARDLHPELR
jgi:ABC-type Fe3+-hydroxamate transport system substrate-binding protein